MIPSNPPNSFTLYFNINFIELTCPFSCIRKGAADQLLFNEVKHPLVEEEVINLITQSYTYIVHYQEFG